MKDFWEIIDITALGDGHSRYCVQMWKVEGGGPVRWDSQYRSLSFITCSVSVEMIRHFESLDA